MTMFEELMQHFETQVISLKKGDILLIHSDGSLENQTLQQIASMLAMITAKVGRTDVVPLIVSGLAINKVDDKEGLNELLLKRCQKLQEEVRSLEAKLETATCRK